MKLVLLQAEGLAFSPQEELKGGTPLPAASTPNLDFIVRHGEGGRLTIPSLQGHVSGELLTLALLGYDPQRYYTGPGPFEAASLEVVLDKQDVAFLCHLVTLRSADGKGETKKLGAHLILDDERAGGITTEEARELIDAVNDQLASETIQFYAGKGHRHVMVWAGGHSRQSCHNPRDALGQSIEPFLPTGEGAEVLRELMEASRIVLRNHPVNREREAAGQKPANCLWLWGGGKAIELPNLSDRWAIAGAMASSVDGHLGVGIRAGLQAVNLQTLEGFDPLNFGAYVDVCRRVLQRKDFLFLHVPIVGPTGGREGETLVSLIEAFDKDCVGPLLKSLEEAGDFALLVTGFPGIPPHPGSSESAGFPFAFCKKTGSDLKAHHQASFYEAQAAQGNGRDATRILERIFSGD